MSNNGASIASGKLLRVLSVFSGAPAHAIPMFTGVLRQRHRFRAQGTARQAQTSSSVTPRTYGSDIKGT
jgi:hypothetical protein